MKLGRPTKIKDGQPPADRMEADRLAALAWGKKNGVTAAAPDIAHGALLQVGVPESGKHLWEVFGTTERPKKNRTKKK